MITKETIADATAALLILSMPILVYTNIPVPEYYSALVGAAVAYLFIKHSPNTVV